MLHCARAPVCVCVRAASPRPPAERPPPKKPTKTNENEIQIQDIDMESKEDIELKYRLARTHDTMIRQEAERIITPDMTIVAGAGRGQKLRLYRAMPGSQADKKNKALEAQLTKMEQAELNALEECEAQPAKMKEADMKALAGVLGMHADSRLNTIAWPKLAHAPLPLRIL